MSQLVMMTPSKNWRDTVNEFRKFSVQIRNYFKAFEEADELVNCYLYSYGIAYGIYGVLPVRWTTMSANTWQLTEYDGFSMTMEVRKRLLSFQDLFSKSLQVLTSTTRERLSVLHHCEVITSTRMEQEGSMRTVYHYERDRTWITPTTHRATIAPFENEDTMRVSDTFLYLREQLAGMGEELGWPEDSDSDSDDNSE
jgi:hypothetical protein